MKRLLIWVIGILIFSVSLACAEDVLSIAQEQEKRGWELKLEDGGLKDSNLSFFKAVVYYRKFIEQNRPAIADIETRRFTAFDARRRIIDIFRFGLKYGRQAQKELSGLLDMYKGFAQEYPISKISARVASRGAQVKSEFGLNAYLVRVSGEEIVCLLPADYCGRDLIVYRDLVPVARARMIKVFSVSGADKDKVALAKVYRVNPAVKLKPCLYAKVVPAPVKVESRLSSMVEECYARGKKLFERFQLDDAEEYFYRALKYNPDYARALNMLGLVYFSYGDLANAEKYYLSALESDPAYIEAYINLAGAYLSQEDFPVDTNSAFDMLEGAIAVNTNYPRAYYWLGHLFDDYMFFGLARDYYLRGKKTTPVLEIDNWYWHTSLAKKLSSPGQCLWDTANIYLDDREPMLNSSVYAFGELLKMNPADTNVKKRMRSILEVCPFAADSSVYRDIIPHRDLALRLEKQQRVREAVDEMRTALYLDQLISSRFRSCSGRIPRIKID